MSRRTQGPGSSPGGSVSKKDRKRMSVLDNECRKASVGMLCWGRLNKTNWQYGYWEDIFRKADTKRFTLRMKMKATKKKGGQENS